VSIVLKSGSLNLLSRPAMGMLYLYLYRFEVISTRTYIPLHTYFPDLEIPILNNFVGGFLECCVFSEGVTLQIECFGASFLLKFHIKFGVLSFIFYKA